MKIVGGKGQGADNEKMRVVEIELNDVVGKQFQVHGGSEGNDLFITYYEDGPSGRKTVLLDDPVETAEPPAPFWVKPAETWEFLAQDLVKDAQDGIVDIVAESCLHGMVIRGWQGEAWGRLHVNLAKAMKEVMA